MKLEIAHTGPLEVNTYILMDEESKEAVLIDVGGDFENIKKSLDKKGYKINFILNTHGHFDHVLGEVEIQQKYPEIQILMHKDDTSHFSRLQEEMQYFGINYATQPLKPNEFIDENSMLFIGKNRIEAFYTPGHSKGSLSYYVEGKVFTGDALFYRSIGRTDFFDGDYDTLIESIRTKLLVMPDETLVYPGHGPSSTIKDEKKHNPYLK
ncbi:MAG: MBL fold metallo-hydrolase [Candidatus Gastranaerophilales bacterium]|nr:MBL fold metallo-hydrolase [Candidatus Gastranaerophilales bacterium]